MRGEGTRTKAKEVAQSTAAEPCHSAVDDAWQARVAVCCIKAAGGGLLLHQFLRKRPIGERQLGLTCLKEYF